MTVKEWREMVSSPVLAKSTSTAHCKLYRATRKGLDFKDDYTEFILSRSVFIIPCNCKIGSLFFKSFYKPIKDEIKGRKLHSTLGST